MDWVRTPDERFAGLADWPYEPRYTLLDNGLRMAHVDVAPEGGAVAGATVLCLHGEPSWGYLYRRMVPVFTAAGMRVVVPDLIGFGRSDKPVRRDSYSYQAHVDWLTEWLISNRLSGLTLVCQDWGGLLGLRLASEHPDRFERICAANTFLPTGDTPATEAFLAWRRYSQDTPDFNVGKIVQGGCASRPLAPEVVAAYDAPFPDDTFKAGARAFPALVPITADDPASAANRRAWEVLDRWEKPFLCAFGDQDAITRGGDGPFRRRVPGAAGQPHTTIEGGGHFLQEDRGVELAGVVVAWMAG